jgi:F0F1-type ATP synthase membrane subunit b/b'
VAENWVTRQVATLRGRDRVRMRVVGTVIVFGVIAVGITSLLRPVVPMLVTLVLCVGLLLYYLHWSDEEVEHVISTREAGLRDELVQARARIQQLDDELTREKSWTQGVVANAERERDLAMRERDAARAHATATLNEAANVRRDAELLEIRAREIVRLSARQDVPDAPSPPDA